MPRDQRRSAECRARGLITCVQNKQAFVSTDCKSFTIKPPPLGAALSHRRVKISR